MAKEKVEMFRRSKSKPPTGALLPGGRRLDTTPAVPAQEGGPWEKPENNAKRNTGAADQASVEYETDEDEFSDVNDDHQLMKSEPTIIYETDEDELEGEDPGTISSPPFVRLVTLGQSKRSPGDTLLNIAECPQVRHEHPWMKTEQRVDDERGDGVLERRKATAKRRSKEEYSLAYFNLWWRRMEREAAKMIVNKEVEEERDRQERSLRNMLTNKKRKTASEMEVEGVTVTDSVMRLTMESQQFSSPNDRDDNLLGPRTMNPLVGREIQYSGVNMPKFGGDRVLSARNASFECTQESKMDDVIFGQHHTLPDLAPVSDVDNGKFTGGDME